MGKLKMTILKEGLGVCRLSPKDDIPSWGLSGKFFSITRTGEELSVVCEEQYIPEGINCECGWRALKVEGPLEFSLTGILAKISGVLAEAGVSIFAVSTYDTDYILVKNKDLDKAVQSLINKEYVIAYN
jgi:hypothetical protein